MTVDCEEWSKSALVWWVRIVANPIIGTLRQHQWIVMLHKWLALPLLMSAKCCFWLVPFVDSCFGLLVSSVYESLHCCRVKRLKRYFSTSVTCRVQMCQILELYEIVSLLIVFVFCVAQAATVTSLLKVYLCWCVSKKWMIFSQIFCSLQYWILITELRCDFFKSSFVTLWWVNTLWEFCIQSQYVLQCNTRDCSIPWCTNHL